MLIPSSYKMIARDPFHPFRVEHGDLAFSPYYTVTLDDEPIEDWRISSADAVNGVVRVYVGKNKDQRQVEKIGKVSRFRTVVKKGRVQIFKRKELA